MDDCTIFTTAISAGVGLVTAVISGLLTYNFKRFRIRKEERKLLMKESRDYLKKDNFQVHNFISTALYLRLRPLLSKGFTQKVEPAEGIDHQIFLGKKNGIDILKLELSNELYRIEKDWNLI